MVRAEVPPMPVLPASSVTGTSREPCAGSVRGTGSRSFGPTRRCWQLSLASGERCLVVMIINKLIAPLPNPRQEIFQTRGMAMGVIDPGSMMMVRDWFAVLLERTGS